MRSTGKTVQLSEDALSIIDELTRRVTILESSLGVSRLSEPITARITGIIRNEDEESGNFGDFIAYRWVRLFEGENGTVTMPGQIPWRGAEDNPARERSGKQDVPIDGSAIVKLYPSEADPTAFLFDWSDERRVGWIQDNLGNGSYTIAFQKPGMYGAWEDDPAFGTTTAYEANGHNDVANGTIVDLRRAYCSGAPRIEIDTTVYGDGNLTYTEQSVRILGSPASGEFKLLFTSNYTYEDREWTEWIPHNANATGVANALNNLTIAGGSFSVGGNGTDASPFLVTFPSSNLYPLLEAHESSLRSDQEWAFFAGPQPTNTTLSLVSYNTSGIVIGLDENGTQAIQRMGWGIKDFEQVSVSGDNETAGTPEGINQTRAYVRFEDLVTNLGVHRPVGRFGAGNPKDANSSVWAELTIYTSGIAEFSNVDGPGTPDSIDITTPYLSVQGTIGRTADGSGIYTGGGINTPYSDNPYLRGTIFPGVQVTGGLITGGRLCLNGNVVEYIGSNVTNWGGFTPVTLQEALDRIAAVLTANSMTP
jgi:hypothetical protein